MSLTDLALFKFVEAGLRFFNLLKLVGRSLLKVNNSLENETKIAHKFENIYRKFYFSRIFRF